MTDCVSGLIYMRDKDESNKFKLSLIQSTHAHRNVGAKAGHSLEICYIYIYINQIDYLYSTFHTNKL